MKFKLLVVSTLLFFTSCENKMDEAYRRSKDALSAKIKGNVD
jgi:hypothetical protein